MAFGIRGFLETQHWTLASLAHGEVRPESDVDLLVDMAKGRSLLDVIAIKQDLEDLLRLALTSETISSRKRFDCERRSHVRASCP